MASLRHPTHAAGRSPATTAARVPVPAPAERLLEDLRGDLVRLAATVTGTVTAATDALLEGDLDLARRVIVDDDEADALAHLVVDRALELLGGAVDDPADRRFVVSTLRVAEELERSADLMVNVAKTTWRLHPHHLDGPSSSLVVRLGRQAGIQTRVAVNAFLDRDTTAAHALEDMDDTMGELYDALLRHVLTTPRDDAWVPVAVQVALAARHYERVGDHAVSIARRVSAR